MSLAFVAGSTLSREQMKKITGGTAECDSCTQEECKGSCSDGGNLCGWVKDKCECTILQGGPMQ